MTKEEIQNQKWPYRSLIGKIGYLPGLTRPDLAYSRRKLSKFVSCFNESHWKVAIRLCRYLKATKHYGLLFDGTRQQSISFLTFSDASFGSVDEERRSVGGSCHLMAGAAISARSAAFKHITLDTCESEISALTGATKETRWLRMLLKELGFEQLEATKAYCDNTSAIAIVKNPVKHPGTKHIEIKYL